MKFSYCHIFTNGDDCEASTCIFEDYNAQMCPFDSVSLFSHGKFDQRETGKIFLSRKEDSGLLTRKGIVFSSLVVSVRAATFPANSVVVKCLGMGSLLQGFLHFPIGSILTF